MLGTTGPTAAAINAADEILLNLWVIESGTGRLRSTHSGDSAVLATVAASRQVGGYRLPSSTTHGSSGKSANGPEGSSSPPSGSTAANRSRTWRSVRAKHRQCCTQSPHPPRHHSGLQRQVDSPRRRQQRHTPMTRTRLRRRRTRPRCAGRLKSVRGARPRVGWQPRRTGSG